MRQETHDIEDFLRQNTDRTRAIPRKPQPSEAIPTRPMDLQPILKAVRQVIPREYREIHLYTKHVPDRPTVISLIGEWDSAIGHPDETDDLLRLKQLFVRASEDSTRESFSFNAPITDFLDRACALYRAGHQDVAVDLVFDVIDDLLHKNQFAVLDTMLFSIDPSGCPSDLLMAVLATTAAAACELACRAEFVNRAKVALRSRSDFDQRAIQHMV